MWSRFCSVVLAGALLVAGAGCDGGGGASSDRATVTYEAVLPDGGSPPAEALEQAADVLGRRFDAAGLDDPQVRVDGDRVVATFDGEVDRELLETLATPGELRFRKVIAQAAGPGASGGAEAERPGDPGSVAQRQGTVEGAIDGEAMQAALALVESGEDAEAAALAPFAELTGPEVAVLPTKLQFYLPTVTCAQLAARPVGSVREPAELVVVCDEPGTTKYLLDEARVRGTDLRDARASLPQGSPGWAAALSFTDEGQPRWTDLTREATQNDTAAPFDPGQLAMNLDVEPDTRRWRFARGAPEPHNRYEGPTPIQCDTGAVGYEGNCLVAIVLDNQVVSAPQILQVTNGDAQITGDFTEDDARLLAAKLQHGALPVALEIESVAGQ